MLTLVCNRGVIQCVLCLPREAGLQVQGMNGGSPVSLIGVNGHPLVSPRRGSVTRGGIQPEALGAPSSIQVFPAQARGDLLQRQRQQTLPTAAFMSMSSLRNSREDLQLDRRLTDSPEQMDPAGSNRPSMSQMREPQHIAFVERNTQDSQSGNGREQVL